MNHSGNSEYASKIIEMYMLGFNEEQIARYLKAASRTDDIRKYKPSSKKLKNVIPIVDVPDYFDSRRVVDQMKVYALHNAGWSAEKIAIECHTSPDQVHRIIHQLRVAYKRLKNNGKA